MLAFYSATILYKNLFSKSLWFDIFSSKNVGFVYIPILFYSKSNIVLLKIAPLRVLSWYLLFVFYSVSALFVCLFRVLTTTHYSLPVDLFSWQFALQNVMVNVVPSPSLLSTLILPSWIWTICFTMARPRPVEDSWVRVRALSTL